jgi:hypothetical protein
MARSNDHDDDKNETSRYTPPAPAPAPAPATVPATDSAARLRDLRLLAERNQLNDADKAELAKLNAAESEAAGHKPVEAAKPAEEPVNTFNEILAILDQLIDLDPRYAGIGARVAAIRLRLNPPPKTEEAKAA